MINIAHLFDHNKGSRYHLMINHGLMNHTGVYFFPGEDIISLGEIIWPGPIDIEDNLLHSDLIFRAGNEHFNNPELDLFMDQEGLWGKTIYYDFSDSNLINEGRLKQCKLYIKRVWDNKRDIRHKILPLDYCLMPEYLQEIKMPRIIDMAYMLSPKKNGVNEDMRYETYRRLIDVDWGKLNVYIGHNTLKTNENGRRLIFDKPENNSFVKYINFLNACKVIWTCGPDHTGGDSRLWEAFGSGALVVTDESAKKYGFIDGYHCLMYNLNTIDETIEKVKGILVGEAWGNISKMGKAGRDYALAHHKPVHRIQKVLNAVN